MLLALLGGVLGVLLAQWALGAVVALGADLIPRVVEIRLDPVALAFSLAVALLTGLLIGLLPALQAARVNVNETLKEASRGSTGGGQRLRASLLVAEVSLSLVLLIAAGLLLTSFARLQRVEPGFEPEGVFTAQLVLPPQRYDRDRLVAFYERFYNRLLTLQGSSSAALTDRVPLTGAQAPAPVAVKGRTIPPLSERPHANRHLVSPKYFATLEIPIRAGRDFDERDSARVPHVAIVNETFARRHFPGQDPIGQTLITGMGQLPSQIVGVVADVRSTGLNTPPEADYFLPALQRPETFTNIIVRTTLSPAAMAPAVRAALRAVDPDIPLLQPQALSTRVAQTIADRKLALALLAVFAALALVLACLGVLQRNGASGGGPYERDRHSDGARGIATLGDAHGARPWPPADAPGHRARHRRCVLRIQADAAGAVRGQSCGSARLPHGGRHATAGGRIRIVASGSPRDEDRSRDRPAGGMSGYPAEAAP